MTNPPTIHRKPSPILLRPWPLHRQVPSTHNALPQIIKTVMDVVLLRPEQHLLDRLTVIAMQRLLGEVVMVPDVRETVQLMEERDVVYGAVLGVFARGEVVGAGRGDEDEAVARGHEFGPADGGSAVELGDRKSGEAE